MSIKQSRRDFLKMSLAAAGGMALAAAGCTPGAKDQAAQAPSITKDNIKLALWMSDWGKDWNDPMLKLSDAFTKDKYPNIAIEWTFLPNVSEKLVAAISGGNAPDITLIDEGYGVPKIARLGGLNSLKSYYDRDGAKKEDFIPFAWETIMYKGEPYGVPGGAGAQLLMINKKVWKDAGLDPDAIPEVPTLDQFFEYSQKLYKKDDSGKVVQIGYTPDWNAQFNGVLGFTYYNSDKTKLAVNSPESVAAVEKWGRVKPDGYTYEDVSTMLSGAPTTPYGPWGAGMRGIDADGFWLFFALDKYYPDLDYKLVRFPTPNGKKEESNLYTGWVWDMAIPKGVKHAEESWAFIKYGFIEKGEMLADTLNWTSVLKAFPEFEKRTLNIMGEKNRMAPYLHTFSEVQTDANTFVPYTPIYQQLYDQTGQAIEKVVRGQMGAKQALDEVVTTLQPELDKVQGTF